MAISLISALVIQRARLVWGRASSEIAEVAENLLSATRPEAWRRRLRRRPFWLSTPSVSSRRTRRMRRARLVFVRRRSQLMRPLLACSEELCLSSRCVVVLKRCSALISEMRRRILVVDGDIHASPICAGDLVVQVEIAPFDWWRLSDVRAGL